MFNAVLAQRLRTSAGAASALLAARLLCATEASAENPVFERVLNEPCHSVALDREPYWAALGPDHVTVHDRRGMHREALPETLRGAAQELRVFFGRDYRVRLAGTTHAAQGDQLRYFRSGPTGLRPALDELGPLGKAGAARLVAVLGTADPEIVCRAGLNCLVKTLNGWTKTPAPAQLDQVGLAVGGGWALAGGGLLRLAGAAWLPVGAANGAHWQKADDAFLREDRACVVERQRNLMFHFDGQSWHTSTSPVVGPRSLWGTNEALWIAGDGGAGVFSDGAFHAVTAPRAVAQVLGRNAHDVWLCSAEGLFRRRD